MTYEQTLEYLFTKLPMYQRLGNVAFKKDLTNIITLCDTLGNPQNNFKSIHLAGTNGKGSSSHLLAAILQSEGYKVGLYTSPHLKNFTERIRLNGSEITQNYVVDFVARISPMIDEIGPSFFEISVAMAFDYFSAEKVDFAIIETGLGGRLDSTNIIAPMLSLITNISLDHEAMLGNSLKEIAVEKAGIIKPKTPIIISETQVEVKDVFLQKAKELNAPICFADAEFTAESSENQMVSIFRKGSLFLSFTPELKGKHQLKNMLGVLKTIAVLNTQLTKSIAKKSIVTGIEKTTSLTGLKGRWQQLGEKPFLFCDVGHNKAGIVLIMEQIKKYNFQNLHIVLGTVNDKKIEDILQLFPKEATYYFCKPNVPRGLEVAVLQKKATEIGLHGNTYFSVNEALETAKKNTSQNDFIFVGGSTFVVAELPL